MSAASSSAWIDPTEVAGISSSASRMRIQSPVAASIPALRAAEKWPIQAKCSTRAPKLRAISTVEFVDPVSTITTSVAHRLTLARQRGRSCASFLHDHANRQRRHRASRTIGPHWDHGSSRKTTAKLAKKIVLLRALRSSAVRRFNRAATARGTRAASPDPARRGSSACPPPPPAAPAAPTARSARPAPAAPTDPAA